MLGSPVDIALVAGIALIAFGPKKLPELGKSVGLGIANFKAALLLPVTGDNIPGTATADGPSVSANPLAPPAAMNQSEGATTVLEVRTL